MKNVEFEKFKTLNFVKLQFRSEKLQNKTSAVAQKNQKLKRESKV